MMKNITKQSKENNRDYALRVIRENIINLELKPGCMISEQDIANELNLSRTPVHEAMQELSATKIIEILPQRGSLVSLIDMDLVDEAVFMRSTIESAIVELACKTATEEQLLLLEENINLQEFYKEKGNLDKLMQLDNSFHKMLYIITNKVQCYRMVKTINIHYDRFRELRLHTSDTLPIITEHIAILNAIKEQDSSKACKLIKEHLGHLYVDEREIRTKYPEYFK